MELSLLTNSGHLVRKQTYIATQKWTQNYKINRIINAVHILNNFADAPSLHMEARKEIIHSNFENMKTPWNSQLLL